MPAVSSKKSEDYRMVDKRALTSYHWAMPLVAGWVFDVHLVFLVSKLNFA